MLDRQFKEKFVVIVSSGTKRDKTMADEQMYIVQYIPNDDTQNIDTITG